ncbi:MAG: 1-acyl-sn-glycerol-3-phosphate acyltransferase [Alphaproteobacteria bacterium]|nr:1-acyl-sn-glycerol-3-phosphate acyltransferase [Alphaproteobacteria bacterium]
MNAVRATLFNISFYGITVILAVLYLPLLLLPRAVMWKFAKLWAHITLFLAHHICGIRMQLEGLENRLDSQAIFAAKHQSAFETIALTAVLKKPAFVLKKELLYIPLFGLYLAKVGCVAIDRKAGSSAIKMMIKSAKEKLEQGYTIVIFAEGTRTSPDEEHPTYHPGVAALYTQLGVPLVPVALNSGLCWGRKAVLKKAGIVTIRFLQPFAEGMNRKVFMAQLREQVESHSAQLRDIERTRLGIAGS